MSDRPATFISSKMLFHLSLTHSGKQKKFNRRKVVFLPVQFALLNAKPIIEFHAIPFK